MAFKEDLTNHLDHFQAAPFLFVGAGFSRRYLGTESWEGLLRDFAAKTSKPYEFYSSSANGNFPKIASLIAAEFHNVWWNEDQYELVRDAYKSQASGTQSALKIEVARKLEASLNDLPEKGVLASELEVLKAATVDGIITTNYDPLLEEIFDDFEVFVGQDEMLFAHPHGIGEIYKIHGSVSTPNSLVLTSEDYARFDERNSYLVAKLLTIFVEHPVIFIGYSLSDRNVFQILKSIASVLTNARIEQLQDRLIFIEWEETADDSGLDSVPFMAEGYSVPILKASVSDYRGLFEVLAEIERRFPARVLRQLKDRVYELVKTKDPSGRLFVQDLEPGIDAAEVDVVLGVGAIERHLENSYRGLSRDDLANDVLEDAELNPRKVLTDVLPSIAQTTHAPVYKYLRSAGLLEDDGTLKDPASVDQRVAKRAAKPEKHFAAVQSYRKRAKKAAEEVTDFKQLVKDYEPREVLLYAGELSVTQHDPPALRKFLIDNRIYTGNGVFEKSQWFRMVCLYDWLEFGLQVKPRRKARKSKKPKKK